MGISYRLAAFNHVTDELIGVHAIPTELVPEVKRIAGIPPFDDGGGDYPLDAVQAKRIAVALGIRADTEAVDYFVEPNFEERNEPAATVER